MVSRCCLILSANRWRRWRGWKNKIGGHICSARQVMMLDNTQVANTWKRCVYNVNKKGVKIKLELWVKGAADLQCGGDPAI